MLDRLTDPTAPRPPAPGAPVPPTPTPPRAPADEPEPRVPAKFRDPETGELRVQALLKSYLELERKLARMVELPGPDADEVRLGAFRRAIGVPDTPDAYPVAAPHEMIQSDPEINARLHAAGFTPEQVQLVYDLAAERMVPAMQDLADEFRAERNMERLSERFGGEDKWREVAGQLAAWGRKTLPPEVFEALSSTYEGVLAMHRMMANEEPGLGTGAEGAPDMGESELKRLMADPKYWRHRDPSTVRQVQEGFQRLFPGSVGV